jgi:hypothetical protein
MKVNTTREPIPPKFYPTTIEITFETQEEMDMFATMFNFSPITEAIYGYGIGCRNIRDSLEAMGAEMHNKISYLNSKLMRKQL